MVTTMGLISRGGAFPITADNTTAATTTIRQWSHYQQDIFSAFAGSEDSLLIEAVAPA